MSHGIDLIMPTYCVLTVDDVLICTALTVLLLIYVVYVV